MPFFRSTARRAALLAVAMTAAVAPLPAQSPPDRAGAWREDLDSVLTVFLPRDRSFSPEAREAFRRRVLGLRDSAGVLRDEEIVTRLAVAVTGANNAHTRLYLLRNRTSLRRYPLRVWWFGDGLYVVRAKEEHRDLLGGRITAIGGRPVAEAAARVAPLYTGNASWTRYLTTYTLTSPEVLRGVGVIEGEGTVEMEVATRDGRRVRRTVEPMPLNRTSEPTEAWWDLFPGHPGRDGPWLGALAADSARLPLYLRNPGQNYWLHHLPEQRLLYVSYNRSQDQRGGETTAAFGERLLAEIAARRPEKLVVDLRFNTGGNLDLAEGLFRRLAALPLAQEPGRLFVITGRATFSAGLYQAAVLRELSRAVLVGEPVGDVLDFWSEGGNVLLPNSRLTVHFADRFHSYSPAEFPERRPYVRDLSIPHLNVDVPVEATIEQYLAGRDPALEAVIAYRTPVSR